MVLIWPTEGVAGGEVNGERVLLHSDNLKQLWQKRIENWKARPYTTGVG